MIKFNFTLTQIEYVLAIEKHGQFGKAAEACLITQPTLTMQIQKLEENLGFVLFDRSKKPIKVTDRARPVIEQMKLIYNEAQKMAQLVQTRHDGSLKGSLSVGIIPTLSPYLLPLILPRIHQHLPQLKIDIREMQTADIVQALNRDELDVGILALSLNNSQILERPLFWEPFYVLCQKGHPLSRHKKIKMNELTTEDLWLLKEGHCLRHQVLDLCKIKNRRNSQSQFHFESGSIETLKNLVESFGGYTLMPYLASTDLKGQALLIPFERPIPAREVGLALRRLHLKYDLIQAFENQIVEALPSYLKQIKKKDLEVLSLD